MRERPRATITELRVAIDCLPRATRAAMLEGIKANQIIVGAYASSDGICPMLAAHRAGGRTNFISFAKAWDRLAFAGSRRRSARRATERELLILGSQLQASLLEEDGPAPDLLAAIAEHRELAARRPRPQPLPGWGWMRVVRRYDDYERALARLQSGRSTEQRSEASVPPEPSVPPVPPEPAPAL